MSVRRKVIEQALEQGHNFLLKHQGQNESFTARDEKLVVRVAGSLREQLTHIQSQWQELQNNTEKWEKTISLVLEVRLFVFLFFDIIKTFFDRSFCNSNFILFKFSLN